MPHGEVKVKSGTKTLPCTCAHEFQDATYGRRRRVHNSCMSKGHGTDAWRCTVCKAEKTE